MGCRIYFHTHIITMHKDQAKHLVLDSFSKTRDQVRKSIPSIKSLVVLSLTFSFALGNNLQAVVPPVPAAFPNVAQTPGTLLYRTPTDQSRITNIIYHNGWFYTNVVTGSAQKAWNFSNPNDVSTFGVRQDTNMPLFNDHGNHAHTKIGDWVGGVYGADIRRTGLGVNALNQAQPEFATLTPYTTGTRSLLAMETAFSLDPIRWGEHSDPDPAHSPQSKRSSRPASPLRMEFSG